MVLPLVLLGYSVPVTIADYYRHKSNKQLEIGHIEKAVLTIEKATLWNPRNYN